MHNRSRGHMVRPDAAGERLAHRARVFASGSKAAPLAATFCAGDFVRRRLFSMALSCSEPPAPPPPPFRRSPSPAVAGADVYTLAPAHYAVSPAKSESIMPGETKALAEFAAALRY